MVLRLRLMTWLPDTLNAIVLCRLTSVVRQILTLKESDCAIAIKKELQTKFVHNVTLHEQSKIFSDKFNLIDFITGGNKIRRHTNTKEVSFFGWRLEMNLSYRIEFEGTQNIVNYYFCYEDDVNEFSLIDYLLHIIYIHRI